MRNVKTTINCRNVNNKTADEIKKKLKNDIDIQQRHSKRNQTLIQKIQL